MITFYHAPFSRSSAILWLLEELQLTYDVELIDVRNPSCVPEDYRSIQPNKKVPALVHDGVTVTERAAIAIYLADAFPQAGLAPPTTATGRGPYLSALVHHDAVLDPVLCAHAAGLEYTSNDYPFGLYEDLKNGLKRRLSVAPYAAGDRFTAADVLLASSVHITMEVMEIWPRQPHLQAYLERCMARPACIRAQARDTELVKAALTPSPT